MSQITSGLRSVLSSPRVYDSLQDIMGARATRRELVHEYVRPFAGCRILDIGCGTARILDELPNVEYYGFDLSQRYIEDATRRYGVRGHFNCALVQQALIDHLEPFHIVIATGVMHHLDDEQAVGLIRLAHSALCKGGRLVTIDPCYSDDQNAVSRFLVSRDRGQNVRTAERYRDLAGTIFLQVRGQVKHRVWIPYTHWIMDCQK
jgi:2-polyprenyl-3-methyl-5-hydroxy-6-metoxy-1,4-benzoquinol methylase